jgi:hypothetical protein
VEGVITFTSPADGPYYGSVGTRLVFSRPGGLDPHNLTVTANGQPVTLAGSPDGTVTAVVTPPTDADLGPRGTYRTTFTVACADPEAGPVAVTAELLAQGYRPLRPTGVIASADAR